MTNLILKRHMAAKKNKKKGFTLIELIVVIVIIAIIAAIAVPALTRYIESANKRAAQATAHNIQVVLQAEVTDLYEEDVNNGAGGLDGAVGANGNTNLFVTPIDRTGLPSGYPAVPSVFNILNFNGVVLDAPTDLTNIEFEGKRLMGFIYTLNDTVVEYSEGKFTVN